MALTLSGSGITSANIVDGTITNTDISASANIPASKLSGTGKVLQVTSPTVLQGATTYSSQACTLLTSNIYYPDPMKISNTITKQSATSMLIVTYKYNVDYIGANGVHNFLVWKDSSNFHLDGKDLHSASGQVPDSQSGSVIFTGLGTGSHTLHCCPARDSSYGVGQRVNASSACSDTLVQSYIYITEVEV